MSPGYDNSFIVWVYQNTPVKVGTISGYRAALRWYYKREGVAMPVENAPSNCN
ncbi:hypothetical protein H310_15185 [Aphanomyces invadans]|uniref:Uncharacterized protein n=1 Tax=Aphanomyces invadans TaxID=157072 RepID=A0A024T9I3_9STRA|nr:hypothetical protein H310_15185 [Aphanomyces invadans]ETV89977.1 hypothetical protein H310_15185 [Aphanomyces invadans]|eukprot:XP_008881393.1 hypothetical protein H310_15185 [Aphanomyces invadans]